MQSPTRLLSSIGQALRPAEPLAIVTALAFFVCYVAMLIAGSLGVALYSLLTWSSLSRNYAVVESAAPVFAAVAGVVSFFAFLLQIWKLRGSIDKSLRYCLLGIGGTVIPLFVSFMHYQNYLRTPGEYVISSDKLPYFRRQSEIFSQTQMQQARARQALSRRIDDLLEDRAGFGASIPFSTSLPEREECAKLALGRHTGLLCAESAYVGSEAALRILELRADENLQAGRTSHRLSFLRAETRYRCPFPAVLGNPLKPYPRSFPARPLFDCLQVESDALRESARQQMANAERSRPHPRVTFGLVLLDTTASVVGAKYSILEPVAPRAGLISIAGAALVFAYFVLFASLVLDAKMSRRDDGAQGG